MIGILYTYMKLFSWFAKKNTEETKLIRNKVDASFIDASFKKVSKEIESLRKYDRGEKEIHAPNLRNLVRDLRKSS